MEVAVSNGAVPDVQRPRHRAQAVDASDILIPTLALMQSVSDLAKKGQVKPGDIVRSTDHRVLATGEELVEIIPLTYHKNWVVKRKKHANDSRGEFVRVDQYKSGEERTLPFNWTEEGQHYFRDLYFNLFCLVAGDIAREAQAFAAFKKSGELPDVDASCMPSVIRFKRTSYPAAKIIATHFAQCQDVSERAGVDVPAYGYVFNIGREFIEKDNSYHALTSVRSRKVTEEERAVALRWMNTLATADVKVDDSDIMEEEPSAPAQAEAPANVAGREF